VARFILAWSKCQAPVSSAGASTVVFSTGHPLNVEAKGKPFSLGLLRRFSSVPSDGIQAKSRVFERTTDFAATTPRNSTSLPTVWTTSTPGTAPPHMYSKLAFVPFLEVEPTILASGESILPHLGAFASAFSPVRHAVRILGAVPQQPMLQHSAHRPRAV